MKKIITLGSACLLAVGAMAQDDVRPPVVVSETAPTPPRTAAADRLPRAPGTPPRLKQPPIQPNHPGEFEDGIIEEQGNLNPEAAARIYDSAIRDFDRQKEKAGRALLAAAEAHRKLGHADIAEKYSNRLKAEYPDLAEKYQRGEQVPGLPGEAFVPESKLDRKLKKLDKLDRPERPEKPEKPERPEKMEQQQIEQALSAVDKAMKSQEISKNIDLKTVFDIVNKTLREVDKQISMNLNANSANIGRADKQMTQTGQSIKMMDEKRAIRSQQMAKSLTDERAQEIKENEMLAKEEMDRAREQVREAQKQMQSLRVMKDSLGGPVEALPKPIADDPRYRELKSSYESLVLSMADTSSKVATNAIPLVVEKMKVWVDKIFIPELQSALMKAEREMKEARLELDKANDELSKTRQMEKQMQQEQRAREAQSGF